MISISPLLGQSGPNVQLKVRVSRHSKIDQDNGVGTTHKAGQIPQILPGICWISAMIKPASKANLLLTRTLSRPFAPATLVESTPMYIAPFSVEIRPAASAVALST
jgi:hypothetical protein